MELVLRILHGVIIGGALIVAGVHRTRAHIERGSVSQKEEGAVMLPLRLGGLVIWLSLLIYPFAPRLFAWAAIPLPDAVRIAGAVLAGAGIPLAIWAARAIRSNVTRTVVTRTDHELITHGPYRWIRHPLYTAGLMLFAGLSLMAGNLFFLAFTVLAGVLLVIRLPAEEAHLQAHFGEAYDAYRRRTGAFLPRVGGAR
ncbi:MAG: isoprenylcysteine carboxylmethyltransferase family protein [Chloroflexi bacterium]|nr:isoprenylcysteine carboxylmethyltransferase family protein [Chloroflexota bacterium]